MYAFTKSNTSCWIISWLYLEDILINITTLGSISTRIGGCSIPLLINDPLVTRLYRNEIVREYNFFSACDDKCSGANPYFFDYGISIEQKSLLVSLTHPPIPQQLCSSFPQIWVDPHHEQAWCYPLIYQEPLASLRRELVIVCRELVTKDYCSIQPSFLLFFSEDNP